ncbi:MAG: hypothetical protein LZF61_00140 [Nitrosomonas sp.]|nr:MAG: hypothetical protein LZF61_00140 [Nitrosomonas sp.]
MEQQGTATPTSGTPATQINIRMQSGEHTGHPIYANITAVQPGQGVVILDFGFLDPQTVATINRLVRAGEKVPDTVGARMACRIALSTEAANILAQQLNQYFSKKPS